jgi:hypothetical protein
MTSDFRTEVPVRASLSQLTHSSNILCPGLCVTLMSAANLIDRQTIFRAIRHTAWFYR